MMKEVVVDPRCSLYGGEVLSDFLEAPVVHFCFPADLAHLCLPDLEP